MLVLTRRAGEKIIINNDITITVLETIGFGKVRLGIDAPPEVIVHRKEVYDRLREEEEIGGEG